MRMFLIAMCDIFLILYLTSITNTRPGTVLTVDDFYTLRTMHQQLKADKEQSEEALQEQLRKARQEKEKLAAEIAQKKDQLTGMKDSLAESDTLRAKINEELRQKEQAIASREQELAKLNQDIAAKEEARRKMEAEYKQELQSQKQVVEETQRAAQEARQKADQMTARASEAALKAQTAESIRLQAEAARVKALKDKEEAERRAADELAARQKAEEEKQKALEARNAAQAQKEEAEAQARQLTRTVEQIKQDAQTAYQKNIEPQVQRVFVSWEREASGTKLPYERELTLLPLILDGKAYAVFPSKHIGYTGRTDRAPDRLQIMFQGRKISSGWINKEEDLIAVPLPGYEGEALKPYPLETNIGELMPALLALRNNGSRALGDKIRGISGDFFIVKRDDLKAEGADLLTYDVSGFRGTGAHGERVVQGDHLSDLNGRLIGVASNANRVVRINSLNGWVETVFK